MTTERMQPLSAVKLALLAKQARSQDSALAYLEAEPIAIIGMDGRFPGAANVSEFWQVLINGVDAISEVPPDRWSLDEFYDPDPTKPGKMNTRWGGFIQGADQFDPAFFGLSPREARLMDPQQRIFLEVAHGALADAGQVTEQLSGSSTGVFVASYHNDYALLQQGDLSAINAYTATGTAHSILANRLSFLLNLHGPSLSIDTACSSSLVALHLACQSLRQRECDLALAGGVSLMLTPEMTVCLSQWGFMAPDGRCKTFDDRADGWVRGEGAGVVVLKRLSDALADKDPILAVVRGSAVNQDGRSNVMTAPNGRAQQVVIEAALANARVSPDMVGYIEAHGTGTVIGDPIEVEALGEAYGSPETDRACYLGAVKTNIGHLEAAAGIAGIIKTVLALQHECIPPNLHFQSVNQHITLADTPFVIPTTPVAWPRTSRPRLAGVSSFGFGGTNSHVILEEAPRLPSGETAVSPPYLIPLSAHSPQALHQLAADLLAYAADLPDEVLVDLAAARARRRSHYPVRLGLVAASRDEFRQALHDYLVNPAAPSAAAAPGKRLFVFSGQGPQWWAMGRELLETEPIFRNVVTQIDTLLRQYTSAWTLLAELTASEEASRLDQTEIAQPAIFALQVGLAALWQSWGITPHAVVGHSIGEVAAAHVAGALTLEEAVRVVYHRGRLMQQATGLGKMGAVALSPEEAEELIRPYNGRLALAAINSPTSTVLSGEADALTEALAVVQEQGRFSRLLQVDYAFHSAQMAPFQQALADELAGLQPAAARLPIYSTVTGSALPGSAFDAAYWGRNVREPVRFAPAVQAAAAAGYTTFLELSPHPVLSRMVDDCLTAVDVSGTVLASLRRQQPERAAMLTTLARLYEQGHPVQWQGLYPGNGRYLRLPNYPWQRQRYWLPQKKNRKLPNADSRLHPLLAQRLLSPLLKETVFTTELAADWPPFLADHQIQGVPLLPATAYVEMALAAGKAAFGAGVTAVSHLLIQRGLPLSEEPVQVQVVLTPPANDSSVCRIFSYDPSGDSWQLHAEGQLLVGGPDTAVPQPLSLAALQAKCPAEPSTTDNYARLRQRGIDFGPTFQGVSRLWLGENEALGEVLAPEVLAAEAGDYTLHPALLDAGLQVLNVVLPDDGHTYVPVGIGQCRVYGRLPSHFYSHAVALPTEAGKMQKGSVQLLAADGRLLANITDITLHRLDDSARFAPIRPRTDWLVAVNWQPQPLPAEDTAVPDGTWLILPDAGGLGQHLQEQLQNAGASVVVPDGRDEGVRQAVQRAMEDAARPLRGIVYLSGCDPLSGDELGAAILHQAQQRTLGSVLALVQELAGGPMDQPPRLWLVTRGAQAVVDGAPVVLAARPLWGMAQSIQQEHPELRCTCIDLNAYPQVGEREALWTEIRADAAEPQVALHNGSRFVARLLPYQAAGSDTAVPVHLTMSRRGILEDLVLQPSERRAPGPGEVEIRVRATGLNFRDVLKALDMYPEPEIIFGDECAGVVTAVGPNVTYFRPGDAVFGAAADSFSTYAIAQAEHLVHKPAQLSFADAAALPVAFITAHYALHRRGKLQPGERVLIHAAAGGVGQAAVQLAQRAGADVWATAGSPEKRGFLRRMGVRHVLDSRTLAFADEIIEQTSGQGVDVILNSLNGDFIERSVAALAENGRFLEMGRLDVWTAEQMTAVRPHAAYHLIFPDYLYRDHGEVIQAILQDVVAGLEDGSLQPLPRQQFSLAQVHDAFRFMAQARHIGKIVVTQAAETAPPVAAQIRPDGAYLITGGFGGIGLHLARWLAAQGARHLTLVGRSGAPASAEPVLAELAEAGVAVTALAADVSQAADVNRVLQNIREAGVPLRGIFHTAGVNADGVLQQQVWENFACVLSPKLDGTWHLHAQSLDQPLDFFVLFSSAAALIGSAGQANYAAANAFLDGFAAWRQVAGLPALSVDWGAWENVGMTAVLSPQDLQRWQRQGLDVIGPEQGMALLGHMPAAGVAQIGVLPIRRETFSAAAPLFAELVQAQETAVASSASITNQTLAEKLADAPASKRPGLLLAHIRDVVRRVLGFDASQIIPDQQPLGDMGMDSLMAVELRNALSDVVAAPLPATLMFDYPTVTALADYLKQYLPAMQAQATAVAPSPAEGPATAVSDLDALSDEEAEALLLAELDQLHEDQA
ncbi:MAG: type I polyketide synthase [Ardenticatenaceae bacterium]|nr:type I polyketide synthase [Ardenticatenaceae bacterium]MCB8987081.1 type I polyketide synthase [Ardenticatenaceae bacterium]